MTKKRKKIRSFFAFVMAFAMVMSLMPSGLVVMAAADITDVEVPDEAGLYLIDYLDWDGDRFSIHVPQDADDKVSFETETESGVWGYVAYFAYVDEEGEVTTVKADELIWGEGVYGCNSQDDDDFTWLTFDKIGDCKVGYKPEGSEEPYYVTIKTSLDNFGFYSDEACTEFIRDYRYSDAEMMEKKPIYFKLYDGAEFNCIKINYDMDNNREDKLADYISYDEIEENTYRIDINPDNFYDFSICVLYNYSDGEGNIQEDAQYFDVSMKQDGLMAYSWIDWDEEDKPILAVPENPEEENMPSKQCDFDIDPNGVILKFIYVDEEGKVQGVKSDKIEISAVNHDGEAEIRANEQDDSFTEIKFNKTGLYKVTYGENENESCMIIRIMEKRVMFFEDEALTNPILGEFRYSSDSSDRTFYVKLLNTDDTSVELMEDKPFIINNSDVENTDYAAEDYIEYEKIDDGVYKITVINDQDFHFKVRITWSDDFNGGEDDDTIHIGMMLDGLVAYDWLDWNDDVPSLHEPEEGENNPSKYIYADLSGKDMIFKYFDEVITDTSKLKVEFDGNIYELNNKSCPVIMTNNEKNEAVINLEFKSVGEYKIIYTTDDGKESYIKINVAFPVLGLYNTDEISNDSFIHNEYEYEANKGATIYCLVNARDDINLGDGNVIFDFDGSGLDENIIFDVEKIDANTYKITLKEGINTNVGLKAHIEVTDKYDENNRWDEWTRFVELYTESARQAEKDGRPWYIDGVYQQGFSACYLTEYEFYENNGLLYNSGDPVYWVHGDSVQAVITKLDELASGKYPVYKANSIEGAASEPIYLDVENTGYIKVAVSHFGDLDLETQYVATSGKLKGIIFDSSIESYKTVPSDRYPESKHDLNENGDFIEDTILWIAPDIHEMFPEISVAISGDEEICDWAISQYGDTIYKIQQVGDGEKGPCYFLMKDEIGKSSDFRLDTSKEWELYQRQWVFDEELQADIEVFDKVENQESITFADVIDGMFADNPYFLKRHDEETEQDYYEKIMGIHDHAYTFPEIHVNMYADMKFEGVFEEIHIGFPKDSTHTAEIINAWCEGDRDNDEIIVNDFSEDEYWHYGIKYRFTKDDISKSPITISLRYDENTGLEETKVYLSETKITAATDDDSTFAVGDKSVELDTPDPNALRNELSEEQKAAVDEGAQINVALKADEVDESDAASLDEETKNAVDKINEKLKDSELFNTTAISKALIDINVNVTISIGNEQIGDTAKITNTLAPLKIRIPIPAHMLGLKEYNILRFHESEDEADVEVLEADVTEDGFIELYSDKFSVYVITANREVIDMSNVKWDYETAFTYDGKAHEVKLVGLPEGVTAKYENNSKTDAGKYKATVSFVYDEDKYALSDTSKIESLDWEIKKLNFDMSNVKWNYTGAFTYDGKAHTVALTGLPAGISATYTGNSAINAGKYEAKAIFSYDTAIYEAPDVSKLSSLTWEIKTSQSTTPEKPAEKPGTTPEKPAEKPGTTPEKPAVTTPAKGEVIKDSKNEASYKVVSTGDNATVEYQKPVKSTATVKVPDTVNVNGVTYKVTSIKANAFKGNKKITSVSMGKNITTIGANAFSGCTNLKTVKMGANVTSVGKQAFAGCTKLTSVTIGSKVTTIGDKAFYKCSTLKKIVIPAKVTKIGANAFNGCKNLKTITIKSTKLKTVGNKAITGINKKAVIKVSGSKLKSYKKLFSKKTGFKKTMTIKK